MRVSAHSYTLREKRHEQFARPYRLSQPHQVSIPLVLPGKPRIPELDQFALYPSVTGIGVAQHRKGDGLPARNSISCAKVVTSSSFMMVFIPSE